MTDIVVYGTNNCSKCKQLEKLCISNNYKIIYKNVEPGDINFKKLISHDVKGFPALELNSTIIHGKDIPEFLDIIKNNQ